MIRILNKVVLSKYGRIKQGFFGSSNKRYKSLLQNFINIIDHPVSRFQQFLILTNSQQETQFDFQSRNELELTRALKQSYNSKKSQINVLLLLFLNGQNLGLKTVFSKLKYEFKIK
ncbi:Hypothetical_protein [Hexamita inflata]|uniref:Hypothetical_protein n=1 Tax=Hexamita inflata TaxID=28002 RepID=A0AA86V5A0_9EUKA|nr:Hypothetical protein HINF_LOCUS44898 [Hexamita inflata]